MEQSVFWLLELKVKPGRMVDVEPLMVDMVEATRAEEPGALHYQWFVDRTSRTVHVHERYADSDAVMLHLKHFNERFVERFLASLEPTRLVVYGEPNASACDALCGFGAVFHQPAGGFVR